MTDFSFELASGAKHVAGLDEVGRGPWAGPVIACAVVIPDLQLPEDVASILTDSKKLSVKKRDYLYDRLIETVPWSLGEATVAEIDELNILQASLLAMRRALEGLEIEADYALVDGNKDPKLGIPTETIVKGDGKSLTIAAASVIAKVHRDRLMADLAKAHPHYAWESNAGYGTKAHQVGLAEFGVTEHHRKSFAPIAKLLAQ